MLEAIGRFRWQSAPFSAWLFRIAHNLAMDHFRAGRRVQAEEDVPGRPAPRSRRPGTRRRLARPSGDVRADRALSAEQRQVLTLKFLFRFANVEVAGILGKTEEL